MIWFGKPLLNKTEEEKVKYCPNCDIKVRKGEFAHDIYRLMYPCVLQWDQLNSLPKKANYYERN